MTRVEKTSQGTLSSVAVPVALGFVIGLLVIGDSLITRHLFRSLYSFSSIAVVGLLLLVAVLVFAGRKWLFRSRDTLLLFGLIASAPLSYLNLGSLDLAEVAMMVCFPIWLLILFTEKRTLRVWPPLILLSLCLATAVMASAINGGFGVVVGWRSVVAKLVLMLMIVCLIRNWIDWNWAIRLLMIMTLINVGVAVVQELKFLANSEEAMRQIVVAGNARSIDNVKMTAFGPMLRPEGFLKILGPAAIPLLILIPFPRAIRFAAFLLLPMGIALSVSFGSYVSAGFVTLLALYLRRPTRIIHYTCAIVFMLGLLYFSGAIGWAYSNVYAEVGQSSGEDRVELFWMGLDALARYPVFGIGFFNIGRISIAPEGWSVHNAFFQVAAETGVFGGVCFAALVLVFLIQLSLGAFGGTDKNTALIFKGLLLALIALICDFMVEPDAFTIVAWMYFGMIAAAVNLYRMGEDVTAVEAEAKL